MKFIHIADMHFDSVFQTLANKPKLAQERRLEQRKILKKIVEYIKQKNIPYFFIAGDLYEQKYIKKSTIEYINNLFKEIEETKIFIVPGNHDPYIKNSFYSQYKWNKNVYIFTEKLQKVEEENVNIYGYGFNNFYMENNYHNIDIEDKSKINILLTHGNLDNGQMDDKPYNLMYSKELKNMEFDYIALGHIHKKSYNEYKEQNIAYPGSTISLGFDELGERGILEGEIEEKSKTLTLKFIPIDQKTFEEMELDITELGAEEDLIEKINNIKYDSNKYYKIVLKGQRVFEINTNRILQMITNENIIRIKNNTSIKYDIREIAKQINLKGLFAKNILQQIEKEDDEIEKEKLLRAFEIGMNILK